MDIGPVKSSANFESVEFVGVEYRRYPDSPSKSASRYFYPYVNGNRAYKKPTLHRAVWEHHFGQIPKGMHIHHKHGDFKNNDISNLECVTPKDHGKAHSDEFADLRRSQMEHARAYASEWHGSPEGREWHVIHGKQTWDNRTPDTKCTCSQCGKSFTSFFDGRGDKRFCSRGCINKYNDATMRYYIKGVCAVCGVETVGRKHKMPKTCSRQCAGVLRRNHAI